MIFVLSGLQCTLHGMSTAGALSDQEIIEARSELAAGRPVAVWFTAAAVGVPVGGSAKILAIGEPSDGEFLQVRPTGSRDELFCSPAELTRTRPSRRRAAAEQAAAPPAKRAAVAAAPARTTRAAAPATVEAPAPPVAKPGQESAPKPAPKTAPRSAQQPAQKSAEKPARQEGAAAPAPAAPARRRAARQQPVEVTVSLHAGPEGEWQVSVVAGKRTVVRPTPVAAADVARAAQCLPDEVGAAVQESLAAARTRQLERVAQLRAELESAQQTLAELGG